jgi:hypothetical protein
MNKNTILLLVLVILSLTISTTTVAYMRSASTSEVVMVERALCVDPVKDPKHSCSGLNLFKFTRLDGTVEGYYVGFKAEESMVKDTKWEIVIQKPTAVVR